MLLKVCAACAPGAIDRMTANAWQIRPWQPTDSLAALTALLHAAYAPLADAGMRTAEAIGACRRDPPEPVRP